ncbi:MAG: STAS domain-containing protein [Phycisphaerae bacterium]
MLRITPVTSQSSARFRLEGKLVGPWVDALREVIDRTEPTQTPAEVEMAAVTFVDESGIELLRELIRQRRAIVSCSNFVAELLRAEVGR